MYQRVITFLLIIFVISLASFAKNTYANTATVGRCFEIYDPYEKLNRKIFALNNTLDKTLIRPSVLLYTKVVPAWPQARINSFFSNLKSPLTFVNNILQGDFDAAGKTFGRFLFNSTMGIGGLLDWSKACGLENKPQQFDDTLMKFDMPYGQYIIIPFLGPSTTRGVAGKVVDVFIDPIDLTLIVEHKNKLAFEYFLAREFNLRVQAEENLDLSKQDFLDEYSFIRSSYLQYLASKNKFCKKEEINYELYN